jgi:ABC-type molybdate transport system ATPase subunit
MEMNSIIFDFQIQVTIGNLQKKVSVQSKSSRLGIMGASGCGKSSFVKALAGINTEFRGEFKFHNQNINSLAPWERNFSFLPQTIQLLPHLNVQENLLFPKNSSLNDEVISGLEIRHLLDRMPRNLSGGEKQRVGLARALCFDSKLLILDEPFSSLDTKTKSRCLAFLDKYTLRQNIPMLVVSHQADELLSLNCQIHTMDTE